MADECPACGAGRNEETDALYARIGELEVLLGTAKAWVGKLLGRQPPPVAVTGPACEACHGLGFANAHLMGATSAKCIFCLGSGRATSPGTAPTKGGGG